MVSACGGDTLDSAPNDPIEECAALTPKPTFHVETIAQELEVPWGIAVAPDNRIFLTERPGRVRVLIDGVLDPAPWATIDVAAEHEEGLLDIALSPAFGQTGHVYVVGTFQTPSPAGIRGLTDRAWRRIVSLFTPAAASRYSNRVLRLRDSSGVGVDATVIIDDLPANILHAGAALAFGPDGMMYVTTGEARDGRRAQDPDALEGKILRFRPDGGIPSDNPVRGSPLYALGFRNPQALAWDETTAHMWALDHGPSGLPGETGGSGRDELNLISAGSNYGWPRVAGRAAASQFSDPVGGWDPAIAPAGLALYDGDRFPWSGNLLVGALRGQSLRRLQLEAGVTPRVVCEEVIVDNRFGRIRRVAVAADGTVYFTTSNRDGRWNPDPVDDRLLRIVPGSRP